MYHPCPPVTNGLFKRPTHSQLVEMLTKGIMRKYSSGPRFIEGPTVKVYSTRVVNPVVHVSRPLKTVIKVKTSGLFVIIYDNVTRSPRPSRVRYLLEETIFKRGTHRKTDITQLTTRGFSPFHNSIPRALLYF